MACCGHGWSQRNTKSGGQSVSPKLCEQHGRKSVRYKGKLRQIRIEGGHAYGMHGKGDVFCMFAEDWEKVEDNPDFELVT